MASPLSRWVIASVCRSGQENLCDAPELTGCTIDGGYAEYPVADSRYCFRLPAGFSDVELAPWLCAGLIGYRALRKTGDARRLGIYGFGAAAHIIAQLARYEGRETFAFTRPGDIAAQSFARELGATWAGGSDENAPEELDAAILLAPVGALVPKALGDIAKGGIVVCGGIHMSDIPQFPMTSCGGNDGSAPLRISPGKTDAISLSSRKKCLCARR
jgi:propanol-preferring alcohol dehydrogenase